MKHFEQLKSTCLECGLPQPELRIKMWVTVVSIGDYYNKCYPDTDVSIKMAIQWCAGYLEEKHAVK